MRAHVLPPFPTRRSSDLGADVSDMTIASPSGAGVLNDAPTMRRPTNIDRDALRRAAEERDKPKRNHLMEVFNSATTADRKSTRLNSSHLVISYAVFCLQH